MIYYYARVSSKTQNLDRQVSLFKEMGANQRDIFADKSSGKNFDRKEWLELMQRIQSNDIIIIKNLDRLGRNSIEVREELINLAKKNIIVKTIDQAYLNYFLQNKLINKNGNNLAESVTNIILDTMLEIDLLRSEFERKELINRQKEGIKRAKDKGVHFGRKKDNVLRENFINIYKRTQNKLSKDYITVTEACKILNCSRNTFYLLKKESFALS